MFKLKRLKSYFLDYFFTASNTNTNQSPIFIGGDGRSGTTLLSVVLDSHPDLAVGPELHFSGPKNLGDYTINCAELLIDNNPKAFGLGLKNNPELKFGVQFVKRCLRFGVEYEEVKELCEMAKEKTKSNLELFADRLYLIDLLGRRRLRKTKKKFWGMKIMRDISKADKYNNFWPNAMFIHIIRDGRDVASSQIKEHSTWGYGDIEKAANNWVKIIKQSRRIAYKYNLNYYEVKYEDLVFSPKETQKKLCDFLGIQWSKNMNSHESQRHSLFDNPFNHASISQVERPINTKAVSRYKKDLSQEEVSIFNNTAKEILTDLNYDL